MNTYANMLERAVVINSLKSEDIFSAIAELTDALVAAGSLPESKRGFIVSPKPSSAVW